VLDFHPENLGSNSDQKLFPRSRKITLYTWVHPNLRNEGVHDVTTLASLAEQCRWPTDHGAQMSCLEYSSARNSGHNLYFAFYLLAALYIIQIYLARRGAMA